MKNAFKTIDFSLQAFLSLPFDYPLTSYCYLSYIFLEGGWQLLRLFFLSPRSAYLNIICFDLVLIPCML